MSSLDSRIRNEQDLAGVDGQWGTLAATRQRGLLHSLLVSFAWILVIALTVLIADRYHGNGFSIASSRTGRNCSPCVPSRTWSRVRLAQL